MNNLSVFKRLKKIESQDATMPDEKPLVLSRGKGSFLWDVEGKKYIDLCGGFGSLALGHKHPRLQSVLEKSSLYQGMGDVYASLSKLECLEVLKGFLPEKISRGSFAVTGSQAVEMAIKTACLATGGSGVISFSGAYHGLDLGVLPLAGRNDFKEPFKDFFPKDKTQILSYGASSESLLKALEGFKVKGVKPACVVVEPVLGRGGVVFPKEGWLQKLSLFCKENKILLILDEILTGLGRIGSYSSSFEVDCDLVCLGKLLGGGFPLSACFGKEEVMKAWDLGREESLHTGTFFGHALMCELAKETLLEIKESSLCERSLELGSFAKEFLESELKDVFEFKEVRSKGLLLGLEFKEDGFAVSLMRRLKEKGVVAIPSGEKARILSLTPPLNIEKDVLKEAMSLIIESVQELSKKR